MYVTSSALAAQRNIVHGFFTRKGGVSKGVFAELNCGGWNTAENSVIVEENRRRVAQALHVEPSRLLSVRQVHGTDVATIEHVWEMDSRPQADAMVTRVAGFGLGVLTADCAPVLFADAEHQVIGAAHSGWKGAFAGINEATVLAMENLGAHRRCIVASIGPTIAQASYEIDDMFWKRSILSDPSCERFFTRPDQHGHRRFDLPAYVHHRLAQAGIQTIACMNNDTYQEADQFYSFRRATHLGEHDYGRQISVIALES